MDVSEGAIRSPRLPLDFAAIDTLASIPLMTERAEFRHARPSK
jgi:hypothetical protein